MLTKILKVDWLLLASAMLLLAVGVIALYSLSIDAASFSENVFLKQSFYAALSLVGMVALYLFDYHYFRNYSTAIYFTTLGILGLVLVVGKTVRGTAGWIGVGPFHIQPAEIAKLSLIIFLASFISQKKSELGSLVRLVASFILTLFMIALVLKQPDFGSAMILGGIWLGMTLLSGINKKHIAWLAVLGMCAGVLGWFLLAPYQKDRLYNFVSPENDPKGSGYNVIQSIIAVGSGGLIGKGIGNGSQSQLNFLPEKHTDFIFAMIAEELGFAGSAFVLALILMFLFRAKRVARSAPDNFGYLLAAGIQIMIFLQILVNIGMNIGLMPVTGIPLPFLSYGGSALVTVFVSLGILLNINSKRKSNLLVSGVPSFEG